MSLNSKPRSGDAFGAAGGVPRLPPSSGPCPCGRDQFGNCCGPLLEGRPADTAEDLMRSRYVAFVVGDDDHLFRTWHPRTRPAEVSSDQIRWTGLNVVNTGRGGANDSDGIVEFIANYQTPDGKAAQQRERSRFTRRGGLWMYYDADG